MNNKTHTEVKIKAALMLGHFDLLEQLLSEGVKEDVTPSLLRRAYEALGDYYTQHKRWIQAAQAYEHGREAVPYHARHVIKELQAVRELWKEAKLELTVNDLVALSRFIEDLLAEYQRPGIRRFYSPAIEIGEIVLGEIAEQLNIAPTIESSPYSADLSQLIISKYAFLTEEQRAKEFAKIIGKALRKVAIKKKIMVPNGSKSNQGDKGNKSKTHRKD